MHEPFGSVSLEALPAPDVRHARTSLALYAVEPRSTVTVALNVDGLKPGDIAGLILFCRPYAWLGVERFGTGFTLASFDEQGGETGRIQLRVPRVWLQTACDFVKNEVVFRYSTDGSGYGNVGRSHTINGRPTGAHAICCSLFSFSTKAQAQGGHADFDSFIVATDHAGR